MRIAITNSVVQNGGDAAISLSLHRVLSGAFPDAAIECHDARPEVAALYYPGIVFKPGIGEIVTTPHLPARARRFAPLIRRIRECPFDLHMRTRSRRVPWIGLTGRQRVRLEDFAGLDAIVSTGGTYLNERYDFSGRLFEYRLAQALGIPVFFYTQSLGPFDQPRNRRLLKQIFDASPLVLLRDERSRRHLEQIGVTGEQVQVTADSVFTEGIVPIRYEAVSGRGRLKLGVSVRAFPPTTDLDRPEVKRFAIEVAHAIDELGRRHPIDVTFISTCQGVAEYWCDDSHLAQRIYQLLGVQTRRHVRVDAAFHSPDELRDQLATFDVMIATRMHGAIQALIVNTPVLPISYEFKTDELFARLGMSDYVLNITTVTASELADGVSRLVAESGGLVVRLAAAVTQERQAALDSADRLCERIQMEVALSHGGRPGVVVHGSRV